ncbi:FAD-dependent oxidoreductase [Mangrovicoccus ximenensis]|uniref:FAD-dependent oxidoreductase n=1 Tax=Mangrovicoccus ximenensis TaxID=1911570 RepID=UPI000D38BE6B|nr:FAD-dependent oxidoreductase [Mangrovicoccus ximenensis]
MAGGPPYLAVTGLSGGRVVLSDRITGERFSVAPRLLANCAGPWIDRLDAELGVPEPLSEGTKGSHLVMERPDLAAQLGGAMLYFETHDHRACLIYALDGRMVLLGTTDLRCTEIDGAQCSEEEIDYLFGVLEDVLPGAAPERSQIRFAYAGVRPLPRSDAGVTGAISRDHSFRDIPATEARPFPMIVLVGGKWTTYRACAEQLADRILGLLGEPRRKSTLRLKVGGGADFPAGAAGQAALAAEVAVAGPVGKAQLRQPFARGKGLDQQRHRDADAEGADRARHGVGAVALAGQGREAEGGEEHRPSRGEHRQSQQHGIGFHGVSSCREARRQGRSAAAAPVLSRCRPGLRRS